MQEPHVPPQPPLSTALRRPGRYRLLYIDRGPSQTLDRSHIACLNEIAGEDIDLITAPAGECDVALARSCQPDLILLELGAPWSSGIEVVTLLRESRETYLIPIVGLSSTDCVNLPGLSMYCRRPIEAPAFLAMLRLVLRRASDVSRRVQASGGRGGSALARRRVGPSLSATTAR